MMSLWKEAVGDPTEAIPGMDMYGTSSAVQPIVDGGHDGPPSTSLFTRKGDSVLSKTTRSAVDLERALRDTPRHLVSASTDADAPSTTTFSSPFDAVTTTTTSTTASSTHGHLPPSPSPPILDSLATATAAAAATAAPLDPTFHLWQVVPESRCPEGAGGQKKKKNEGFDLDFAMSLSSNLETFGGSVIESLGLDDKVRVLEALSQTKRFDILPFLCNAMARDLHVGNVWEYGYLSKRLGLASLRDKTRHFVAGSVDSCVRHESFLRWLKKDPAYVLGLLGSTLMVKHPQP